MRLGRKRERTGSWVTSHLQSSAPRPLTASSGRGGRGRGGGLGQDDGDAYFLGDGCGGLRVRLVFWFGSLFSIFNLTSETCVCGVVGDQN